MFQADRHQARSFFVSSSLFSFPALFILVVGDAITCNFTWFFHGFRRVTYRLYWTYMVYMVLILFNVKCARMRARTRLHYIGKNNLTTFFLFLLNNRFKTM